VTLILQAARVLPKCQDLALLRTWNGLPTPSHFGLQMLGKITFFFFLLLYVELAPSSANEASRAWEPRLTRLVTSSSKNTFGNVESVAFRVNKLTEIDMGNQLW
jgi:hypothetical protein